MRINPEERRTRVGYVVKRYPRYSETFIVNEILAHEAAGWDLCVFSLYPPNDEHFQDSLAWVRAPVTYLCGDSAKAEQLWSAFQELSATRPAALRELARFHAEDARTALQAIQLANEISRRGIEHLHAHFATSSTSVARMAAALAGITYSFTAHAKDIYHESVLSEDLRRKLRDAVATVTVSEYNVRHLRNEFGPDASRVVRIYNGLDLGRFTFTREPRPPVILSVGRLVEKKGFEVLIDACALLGARRRDFRCRIIGTGPLEGELRQRAAAHGLDDLVELTGALPQAAVIEELRNARLFAGPYVVGEDGNRDGLPTVLLEAMALGTPCVATDVTGVPEVVISGRTGLLVPQRDPVALAESIESLLDDRELREELAEKARALIEEEFDIRRNASYLRELFSAALAEREVAAAR